MEDKEEKEIKSFKDLHAWKEGHALVLKIYSLTKKFPRSELFGLSSQIQRAAVSVTSNIAEGFARQTFKEKVQFYNIARGSLVELENQLLISKDVGYITQEEFVSTEGQVETTHRILNALMRASKTFIISLFICVISTFVFFVPCSVSAAGLSKPANNLGLVGYWKFNEGTSTAATDSSGKGDHGAFPGGSGNPTWRDGKFGNALSFDGGDSLNMGSALPLRLTGTITVSAWIKPSSVTADQKILSNDNSSNGGYKFGLFTNSKVEFEIKTSGNNPTTNRSVGGGTTLQTGVWYHVVGVYSDSGDYIKTYVNGVIDRTNSSATGVLAAPASGTFGIGYGPGEGYYFNGTMDDVRVYNRVLTDAEIAALYNSGSAKFGSSKTLTTGTALANGLVGHWTFDGKDMYQNVTDASGNANIGRLVGFTATTTSPGKLGQSLKFNGSTSYVTITDSASISSPTKFTVTAWVRPSHTNSSLGILQKPGWEYSLCQIYLSPSSASMRLNIWNPGGTEIGTVSGTVTLSPNEWYFVAGTYESGVGSTIYFNGTQVGFNGSAAGPTDSSQPLHIGHGCGAGLTKMNGSIDDVRIYNRALSASEVKQLYNLGGAKLNASSATTQGTGLASGLVGHWTFDGADTTTTIADKSGQNRNGYFIGGATSSAKAIGKLGQALKFDGVDDSITNFSSSISAAGSSRSVCLWFKTLISSDIRQELIGTRTGGSGWAMNIGQGNVANTLTYYHTGVATLSASTPINTNTWYHTCATYDASTQATLLYKDGAFLTSASMANDSAGGNGRIGSDACVSGTCYVNGSIDDVRIYNRALTADEVKQLYLMGK